MRKKIKIFLWLSLLPHWLFIEYIKSKLVELTDLNKANYSKDEYDRQIRNINRDILILFTWNDILFGRYDLSLIHI